ncbi:MAG: hypothetical protein K940chlam3_00864 [Chlamydiae bacterium]|nr:hypothetical protein [Chlamydiota bacterium]
MQLFATDENGHVIVAQLAKKQTNYLCPECRGLVRVRGGKHRQPHFFHLHHNSHCRQSEKSLTHLSIQHHIERLLPKDEVILECRFPKIFRIADVVWLTQRLIFEVQCSPIAAEEVLARNRDYQSEGFQVIWIFHDQRFNQWRVASAEEALKSSPVYYTNINAEGKGMIYDQYSCESEGIRKHLSQRMKVDLSQPKAMKRKMSPYGGINQRIGSWPVHFRGDLLDVYSSQPQRFQELKHVRVYRMSLHRY